MQWKSSGFFFIVGDDRDVMDEKDVKLEEVAVSSVFLAQEGALGVFSRCRCSLENSRGASPGAQPPEMEGWGRPSLRRWGGGNGKSFLRSNTQ